jgi:hypothetical protein
MTDVLVEVLQLAEGGVPFGLLGRVIRALDQLASVAAEGIDPAGDESHA